MPNELSIAAIEGQVPPRAWKYEVRTLPTGERRSFRRAYTQEEQIAAFHAAYTIISTGYLTPCWAWTGCLADAYGRFQYEKRPQPAHRVSWKIFKGPIPAGLFVCHKCDFRPCVNPDHLFLGTNAENQQDAVAKGRKRSPHGERHHRARLLEEQVRTIKSMLSRGAIQAELARQFGVSKYIINGIARGRGWKHVIDAAPNRADNEGYEREFIGLFASL